MNGQYEVFHSWLTDNGFEPWSEWEIVVNALKYKELRTVLQERNYEGKWVYVFLERNIRHERARVLYVGKAKGIISRLDRHQAEMNTGGLQHRGELMIGAIRETSRVAIYVLNSTRKFNCFGIDVDAYHLEEIAAIKRLKPLWNSEHSED